MNSYFFQSALLPDGWREGVRAVVDQGRFVHLESGVEPQAEDQQLGVVIPPAVEADRCRIAGYFQRLLSREPATEQWLKEFLAADSVQRIAIAADQNLELINLAFIQDLPFLNRK